MIEKCANPRCGSAFTYFRQGRLYKVDPRDTRSERRGVKVQHYWLCGACAERMEIVVGGNGIVLRLRAPSDATDA